MSSPIDHSQAATANHSDGQAVEDVREFWRRLLQLTPATWATNTIIAVNVAIFVLMAVASGSLLSPDTQTLIDWGANFGPRTLGGQWWRTITCMFVHVGIIHLALNMWVFRDAGRLVERLVGNAGFVILYFVSGIAGSLASVFWNTEVVSAGASGAIFGVFGALFSFVVVRSHALPRQMLGPLRSSSLVFLGYNLFFGLSIKWIDMAAHTGGLIAGFACGAIMGQPLSLVTAASRGRRNALVLALGGLAFLAAVHFAPPSIGNQLVRFSNVEGQVIAAYNSARDRAQRGAIDDTQFADAIESDVLQPWRQLRKELDDVTDVPSRKEQFFETLKKYIRAREASWESLVAGKRNSDSVSMSEYSRQRYIADSLAEELQTLSASK